MELTDRETATVLAALRFWQDETHTAFREADPHFVRVTPLTDNEIDLLADRLNIDGFSIPMAGEVDE